MNERTKQYPTAYADVFVVQSGTITTPCRAEGKQDSREFMVRTYFIFETFIPSPDSEMRDHMPSPTITMM